MFHENCRLKNYTNFDAYMSIFSPKKGWNITIITKKSNFSPKNNHFSKFLKNSKNNSFWIKHALTCFITLEIKKKIQFLFNFKPSRLIKNSDFCQKQNIF